MTKFETPMMKQYMAIKKEHPDCLLFFRLGDFYELFLDDAKIGAEILNITLTSRSRGKDGRIPMAGVPYHAVDSYLPKLVKAGYKVAICEQVGDITTGNLVTREVVRIVTPGTLFDESSLEKKKNNYIFSVSLGEKLLGVAIADISTGDFYVEQFDATTFDEVVSNELSRFSPTECVLPTDLYNDPDVLKTLKVHKGLNIYPFDDWGLFAEGANAHLKKHFGVRTLSSFNALEASHARMAASALLGYLRYTQKDKVAHIREIKALSEESYVGLDKATIDNLELFTTLKGHDKKRSLFGVLDHTRTAMGGRMLRQWVLHPLKEKKPIVARYDAIEDLLKTRNKRKKGAEILMEISDIERLLSRLSVGVGNARDLVNLKTSLEKSLDLRKNIEGLDSALLKKLARGISVELKEQVADIEKHIVPEPPADLKNGGLVNKGVSKKLDELRATVSGSTDWLAKFEAQEKKKTGITSLKVSFNQVFGYYIEVTKPNLSMVPKNYIRKQTLVNAERFITPKLKEHEEIILTAQEKIDEMEFEIFHQVVARTLTVAARIQKAAKSVAFLDCLVNFAQLAEENSYCKPEILSSGEITIKEGRHPVVEKFLEGDVFVPNDVCLNQKDTQLQILTGPNMAGKSVFIRQVALLVLMAQMGCYIPAKEAKIGLVDKIFVRSGASDIISAGLSTFMLEMVETAQILNNATKDSLIVMDEIGRGTSTFDGISIAWAVAEYLVTHAKVTPRTLFATHYHELQALEEKYPDKIKNYQMLVDEVEDEPVFLHKVSKGGANHSYGIAVAKLAGVPETVTERAVEMLAELEARDFEEWLNGKNPSEKSFKGKKDQQTLDKVKEMLKKLDLDNTTPLEALRFITKLKREVGV